MCRLPYVGVCRTQRAWLETGECPPVDSRSRKTVAGRVFSLGRSVSSLPRGDCQLVLRHRRRSFPLPVLRRHRLYSIDAALSDFPGFNPIRRVLTYDDTAASCWRIERESRLLRWLLPVQWSWSTLDARLLAPLPAATAGRDRTPEGLPTVHEFDGFSMGQ